MKRRRIAGTLTAICILISLVHIIYIWGQDTRQGTYYTSTTEVPMVLEVYPVWTISQTFVSEQTRLSGIEIMFANIPEDSEIFYCSICKDGRVIYATTIPLYELNHEAWYCISNMNVELKPGEEYELVLDSGDCIVVPDVYTVTDEYASPENRTFKVDGVEQPGSLLMRYGYEEKALASDLILKTLLTIGACLLGIWLIWNYVCIRLEAARATTKLRVHLGDRCNLAFGLTECLLAFVLLQGTGMEFGFPMKVLGYGLSILVWIRADRVSGFIKECVQDNLKKLLWVSGAFYTGFALVGNHMFIYPVSHHITLLQTACFGAAVLWSLPVVALCLEWLEHLSMNRMPKMHTLVFSLVSGLLIIIPAGIALYAYNPGISSIDTYDTLLDYAHHIRNMPDWHPPFYVMLLKAIIRVWDSTYAVIFAQFAFAVFVIVKTLLFLRKRGADERILLLVAFLIGINPANYLFLCTIWKDIPYGVSLLWMTLIIARFVLEKEIENKWGIYIEFIIALVFTFLIRQNGIVVSGFAMVFMLAVFRKNKKIWGACLIAVILIAGIKGPLYSYINVQEPEEKGGIYIGLGQDIMSVYYAGGQVSNETMEMITVLADRNVDKLEYSPYWARSTYKLDVSMKTFIRNYLDTFIRNPVLMLKSVLCRQDCLWAVVEGQDMMIGCVNGTYSQDGTKEWNEYYPARKANEFTSRCAEYQQYTVDNQLLNCLIWRAGLPTLLVMWVLISVMIRKKWKALLIFIPYIGQMISLFLSSGWTDYRYYWPLCLMMPFVILIAMTVKKEEQV